MGELEGIDFNEAVEYAINNKSSLLYAFVPTYGVNKVVLGGIIYTINYEIDSEIDDVIIYTVGGRFNDDFGEEDSSPIKYAPKHAKNQKYRVTNAEPPYYLYGYNPIVTLKRLIGLSKAEVLDEFPCAECDQCRLTDKIRLLTNKTIRQKR